MKAKTKIITGVAVAALALSAQTIYAACNNNGCASKAEEKKESCPSGICSLSSAPKAEKHCDSHNLSTFQMKSIVDAGKTIILDARSEKYDDGTRIPGAASLTSSATPAEVAAVIPSKDAAVVTYCSNLQCPASKKLFKHLTTLGYTNVKEYPEGIAGWKAAGGQIDHAE